MNTIDIWHLIDGKYTHIVQTTDGTYRTFYTNGKKEGIVDITGPMYAKHKYELETYILKSSEGEFERKRAIR